MTESKSKHPESTNKIRKTLMRVIVVPIFIIALCTLLGIPCHISLAIAVFVFTIILVISEIFSRAASALLGGSLMLIVIYFRGTHTFVEFIKNSVHLEVILALLGIMFVSAAGLKSGLLYYIGIKLVRISKGNPIRLYLILAAFTYVLGFFLNYEAGIAVVVSLTLAICSILQMNPIPLILMEIFVSNVAASTSLIAGVPNIVVSEYVRLKYNVELSLGFFVTNFAPITLILFLLSLYILYSTIPPARSIDPLRALIVSDMNPWIFVRSKLEFYVSLMSIVGLVLGLAIMHEMVFISMFLSATTLITLREAEKLLHEIDWDTVLFFLGFYVIVGGLEELGVLHVIANGLLNIAGSDIFILLTILFWMSLVLSGFLDNVPYVVTILPIIDVLIKTGPLYAFRYLFWTTLILTCNIGGVLNTYSSPYNLLGISIAKRAGLNIPSELFYKASKKLFLCSGVITYVLLLVETFATGYLMIVLALMLVTLLFIVIEKIVGVRKLIHYALRLLPTITRRASH